jgi:oligoendopeptidase F
MTHMITTDEPAAPLAVSTRRFVPRQIDLADFSQIQPLFRALLDRAVGTVDELGRWLADFSELTSAIDEYGSRRYIDTSCHTDDPAIEKAFLNFVESVEPKVKPLHFAMQKKFLESPARAAFVAADPRRFAVMDRKWQADVELFREENVPLETRLAKLNNDTNKIMGEMTIDFRGKTYTPQQIARFYEETDRPTRQGAWEAATARRLRDREKIEGIFDQMLVIREQIAGNAGMGDYRQFTWKSLKRFDYTPADCLQFADAIAATCVPVVAELNARRAADLGLERLAPWDLEVDTKDRPPLHPFGPDQTDMLVDKTRDIFQKMAPDLGREFESLRQHNDLDLESRKGKRPGGFQCSLEESGRPFIFMNAAGVQRDVETLLHEGGHAFHFIAALHEPLVFLRSAPMEFCEVASMSMELLGAEHFDVFYSAADADRARRRLLEGIIRFLPWMAVIDSFQHWLYTHPGHSGAQRTTHWLSLLDRFMPGVDWSGRTDARESLWQRQLHLFHAPFYYIEYGIAQLGALQLWMKSHQDPRRALANYRSALALGGTRPLPELFAAAGINFDFSQKTLGPLMNAISEELAQLPA